MRLKDYIQGNRRGKEANRLEREAMNDPFLQDALDGFDAVAGDHVPIIERLERKFTRPVATHHRIRTLWYWSVAASVLLLVGMSAYFFLERTEKATSIIAMNQPDENEDVITDDSMTSQPVQMKELQREMPAALQKTLATPALKESLEVFETDTDIVADVADVHEIAVADAIVHKFVADKILVESSAKSLPTSEQKMPAVQGRVVDETGEPLPGVSILVKGTTTGTVTDIKGNFALKATDTSKLIASSIGYETHEFKTSGEEQTVILKESNATLSEVVVVGYGTQRKRTLTDAGSKASAGDAVARPFGEKEFQTWCQQNAEKNVCDGKGASVRLSFFIDETGKPSKIEYRNYSCEDAKKEMEHLLSSSPVWTKTNRKVNVTVRW
jgi:hypothetical protein